MGDTPGWAFDNIISFIRNHLTECEFYFDYTIYNSRNASNVQSDVSSQEFNPTQNIIYKRKRWYMNIPLLRGVMYRYSNYKNQIGASDYDGVGRKRRIRQDNSYDIVVYLDYYMDKDGDFEQVRAKHTVRGIYTAGFPPKGILLTEHLSVNEFVEEFLRDADALLVGAPSIEHTYEDHFKGHIFFANMAYDEEIFKPSVYSTDKEQLVIGWTGNPNREFKGYRSILVPVIEELQKEGFNIVLKTQFEGSLNSLATFWQSCDLAVIASEADAGPSLFMEASLCGVPSVSTRIGMPAYVIEHEKNGLIIERNKEALKAAIRRLYEDRDLLESMKKVIRRDYISKLGEEVQIRNWQQLFESVLNG